MKQTSSRRFRRRSSPASKDGSCSKKQNTEQSFFAGESSHDGFFHPAISTAISTIHRKCDKCEEENKNLQRQPEKKEEEKLQKKETASSNPVTQHTTTNYINSLSGKGQSLSKQQQTFFGSRMNYDFSNVKIHNDKEAAASAKEINAKAYTIGDNIVFNESEYNTGSTEGKKLLAHELTHVMQNKDASSLLKRKVNYTNSTMVETDPVTTVLDNPRLALTTPLINGKKLPDDLTAAGDILLVAFGSQLTIDKKDGKPICKSNDPGIDCGSEISAIKKPSGKVWQGSASGTKFSSLAEACSSVSNVTVYIKGKSGADAITVYNKVITNEKEHVSDINKAAKKYLEPLIVALAQFNKQPVNPDPSKQTKECQEAYVALAVHPIVDFLKDLDANVKLRDKPGGAHDFKPDVHVDGKDCFNVVVKV